MENMEIQPGSIRVSDKYQLGMLKLSGIAPTGEMVLGGRYYAEFPRAEASKVIMTMEASELRLFVNALQAVEHRIFLMRKEQRTVGLKK